MIILAFLVAGVWDHVNLSYLDSLRTETVEGKPFIIHQVDPKETLYGISKRYHVSIAQILEFNDKVEAGIDIGQIIRVPLRVPLRPPSQDNKNKYHEVQPKETLHSIASHYDILKDTLKDINKMTDTTVVVGQKLLLERHVNSTSFPNKYVQKKMLKGFHEVVPGETLYALSNTYNTTVKNLKIWNDLTGSSLRVGQIIKISGSAIDNKKDKEKVVDLKNNSIDISEDIVGANEVKESGLGKLIEGPIGERKYLALHNSAPKGYILKVRNTLNNREVFVRVIGVLPSDEVNDKIIIRMSKSAFTRLGESSDQLTVELTYYK